MISIAEAHQIILAAGDDVDVQLLHRSFDTGPLTP